MRREIGSEFWSVPVTATENHFFPAQTQWFLSGRSAQSCLIEQLLRQGEMKTVAMPAWCCESMIRPFVDAGVAVRFYPVYMENGRLKQDYSAVGDCDALYLMDYFGFDSGSDPEDFEGIRIRDLTHSLFSGSRNDATYCFGSLRKWAGFYTGGFGWGMDGTALPENQAYSALRREAMLEKQRYISGETDSKAYLSVFASAEELLEQCPPSGGDSRDLALAQIMDIDRMKHRRRENAAVLLEELAEMAIFPELGQEDCPLFVPVLVPGGKRDALRRYLIEHEIYCPVHWPLSGWHAPDQRTEEIYQMELSLVCDQRYTPEDMDRLIQTVKKFWRE